MYLQHHTSICTTHCQGVVDHHIIEAVHLYTQQTITWFMYPTQLGIHSKYLNQLTKKLNGALNYWSTQYSVLQYWTMSSFTLARFGPVQYDKIRNVSTSSTKLYRTEPAHLLNRAGTVWHGYSNNASKIKPLKQLISLTTKR